jgi:hypothetical protein
LLPRQADRRIIRDLLTCQEISMPCQQFSGLASSSLHCQVFADMPRSPLPCQHVTATTSSSHHRQELDGLSSGYVTYPEIICTVICLIGMPSRTIYCEHHAEKSNSSFPCKHHIHLRMNASMPEAR